MTKAGKGAASASPKSERPRSSLGRSDSYRRAKPILSPPEMRKTKGEKSAKNSHEHATSAPPVITKMHELDLSAIKVLDEKPKVITPPVPAAAEKPSSNNFFKNIRSQFSFSSLRIKKGGKKSGGEKDGIKNNNLGDSYRTSGCDPSNDLTPLSATTTAITNNNSTAANDGNGCLNGTLNGGVRGPKATSTPLSACGGHNGRSSASPETELNSQGQPIPPEMRRFRTAAVKNQYQRWSFAEQSMNQHNVNGHHFMPPNSAAATAYYGGQMYHLPPHHQLYNPTVGGYMIHNGHYVMAAPNGQMVAVSGAPMYPNGGYHVNNGSGRPSPVNGGVPPAMAGYGHHYGTYGPSSSRESAGTRRSSLASLIGGKILFFKLRSYSINQSCQNCFSFSNINITTKN